MSIEMENKSKAVCLFLGGLCVGLPLFVVASPIVFCFVLGSMVRKQWTGEENVI